ncbi:hypothetical protein [Eoetvoesiella caeni]
MSEISLPQLLLKGFSLRSELFPTLHKINRTEQIYVGLYAVEGGTRGEFSVVWSDNNTISLNAYNDSWKVLEQFQDFLALLAKLDGVDITPDEFQAKLVELGYRKL